MKVLQCYCASRPGTEKGELQCATLKSGFICSSRDGVFSCIPCFCCLPSRGLQACRLVRPQDLCFLCCRLSALETKLLAADLEASLRFIFDPVDETSFVTAENGTRQIKYEAIVDRIQRGVECDLETETISGEDNGRLGPRDVVMSVERGSLGIEQGTRVLGR